MVWNRRRWIPFELSALIGKNDDSTSKESWHSMICYNDEVSILSGEVSFRVQT